MKPVHYFFLLVILLVVFLVCKMRKFMDFKKFYHLYCCVSYCLSKDSFAWRHGLSLTDLIYQEFRNCMTHPELIPTEKEREYIQEIIDGYKENLANNFFNEKLIFDKPFSKMRYEDYFWFTLSEYISSLNTSTHFNKHCMLNLLNKVSYGSWGGKLYDAEYELTDFGVAYYKLYFIVEHRNGKPTEYILKTLETKRVKISCY